MGSRKIMMCIFFNILAFYGPNWSIMNLTEGKVYVFGNHPPDVSVSGLRWCPPSLKIPQNSQHSVYLIISIIIFYHAYISFNRLTDWLKMYKEIKPVAVHLTISHSSELNQLFNHTHTHTHTRSWFGGCSWYHHMSLERADWPDGLVKKSPPSSPSSYRL